MDAELLQDYLVDATRRGAPLDRGFDGAAGGAPCGDLVRISVELEDGRIARVSFDAEGCATARAAAAARRRARRRGRGARRGADRPRAASPTRSAASGRRAATRSSSPPTPCTARSPRPPARACGLPRRRRPASGCWSRSAAASTPPSRRCIERERGAEVVAVTLKLWADRRTDAEKSCCSPRGRARRPRASRTRSASRT